MFATSIVWTFSWVLVASRAAYHAAKSGGGAAWFNALLSLVATAAGCLMVIRSRPRDGDSPVDNRQYPKESWFKRISGWFATAVWCLVGLFWNVTVFRLLCHAATEGPNLVLVILLPVSAIGFFLLLLVFVVIATILDSLFGLD